MESIKITVSSNETASRPELIIRIFWGMLVGIVLGLIGTIAGVLVFIQWLHILFLGKRHAGIQRFVNAYGIAVSQLKFYWLLTTDERPPIIPEF